MVCLTRSLLLLLIGACLLFGSTQAIPASALTVQGNAAADGQFTGNQKETSDSAKNETMPDHLSQRFLTTLFGLLTSPSFDVSASPNTTAVSTPGQSTSVSFPTSILDSFENAMQSASDSSTSALDEPNNVLESFDPQTLFVEWAKAGGIIFFKALGLVGPIAEVAAAGAIYLTTTFLTAGLVLAYVPAASFALITDRVSAEELENAFAQSVAEAQAQTTADLENLQAKITDLKNSVLLFSEAVNIQSRKIFMKLVASASVG